MTSLCSSRLVARAAAAFLFLFLINMAQAAFYVSEENGGWIEQYSDSGADLGQFGPGGLAKPYGVALDATGNLYIAQVDNGAIEKYSSTGADLGVFATLPSGPSQSGPMGLIFDSAGNLLVSDYNNNRIEKFSSAGTDLGQFNIGGTLSNPTGFAFDNLGNLFVTNLGNNSVAKYSPTGSFIGNLQNSNLNMPAGIVFDSQGRILVSNYATGAIRAFNPTTGQDTGLFANTGFGSTNYGLGLDATGNVWVALREANFLEEFNSGGSSVAFVSSNGSPAFFAFSEPAAVPEASTWAIAVLAGLFLLARMVSTRCSHARLGNRR